MEKEKPVLKDQMKIKSLINMSLGTYKASKIPLCINLISLATLFTHSYSWPRDERLKDYPFIGNRISCVIITVLYVLFSLTWGLKWMENRQPIKPKKIMMIYNLVQIVFCSYMFYEASMAGWLTDYNWKCQPEDKSSSSQAMRMANVVYMYYLSKILDFTDTVFLVLAKGWNSLSMLHVLHHSLMFMRAWQDPYFTPGGHYTFIAFSNSGIHVLMYSYYFLAACGDSVQPYLWWKKFLTTVQMVQFSCVFVHTTQIFFRDCPEVSKLYPVLICCYALTFTALFTDLYLQEYKKKTKSQKMTISQRSLKSSYSKHGFRE